MQVINVGLLMHFTFYVILIVLSHLTVVLTELRAG